MAIALVVAVHVSVVVHFLLVVAIMASSVVKAAIVHVITTMATMLLTKIVSTVTVVTMVATKIVNVRVGAIVRVIIRMTKVVSNRARVVIVAESLDMARAKMVAISKLMAIARALHKAEISAAMDQRAVIVPVSKVLRSDEVKFHDNVVKIEKKVYVLLNKPKGYVTTSDDPQNRKTVMDLVSNACHERIYPVGRLDRNTTGVLLLTNDGELASKLTHPKFLKKKIYHVTTDQNVSAADIHQIAEGITLEDGDIKADAIEYASPTDKKQVGIEIHSGKNRIVRRIFESLGYHVVKLDRVYFAGLTKKNVRRGDWRYLTEKEVQMQSFRHRLRKIPQSNESPHS